MTADDMVSVPIDDLWAHLKDGDIDAGQRLWAILNPPPEFDPKMVEAMAKARYEAPSGHRWEAALVGTHAEARRYMEAALTAARNAGWEMVEATELEALRSLILRVIEGATEYGYPSGGGRGFKYTATLAGGHIVNLSKDEADAIRKAKAAGQ